MLKVKLKEVAVKNTIKTNGSIQYWRNEHEGRIITVHLRDNLVRVYLVNEGPDSWVTDNIEVFTKTIINDMGYVECNENWEKYKNELHVKNIETLEELTDVKVWKSPEGELYMSNWNLYEHVPAMLISLDNDCAITEIYENVEKLRKRMEHLNLHKVPNMLLEEF